MGSLCPCSASLTSEFPDFREKLPNLSLWPLLLLFSLGTTDKNLALVLLPFRYFCTLRASPQTFSSPDQAAPALCQELFPPALSFCSPCFPLNEAHSWPHHSHVPHSQVVVCTTLSMDLNVVHVRQLCAALPGGSIINGTRL